MKLKSLLFICFVFSFFQAAAQGKRPPTPVDSSKVIAKPVLPVVVKDTVPEPVIVLADSIRTDSIMVDSTRKKEEGKFVAFFRKDDKQAPKKALVYSLMLPGAGQVYNKRYWKLPIVYAGFAGMTYAAVWNTKKYKKYKFAYEYRVDTFPETIDTLGVLSDGALKNLRNKYQTNVELAYIGMFAVYGLTAIDAFVDAHMKNFDVGDDLSLQVRPQLLRSRAGETIPGIGLRLQKRQVQTSYKEFFDSP